MGVIHNRKQPESTKHWPPKHRTECWKPPLCQPLSPQGSDHGVAQGTPKKSLGSGRRVPHVNCCLTINSAGLQLVHPV